MTTSFKPIVGIDLGTTNSSIAIIRNGKARILSTSEGKELIPSVVLIDQQGKVTVGEDAKAALVAMPEHTVAAVKRRMGSELPVQIAGRSMRPQEVSALILKELKSYADAELGEGEKEAVITVPAYFTDEQRRATKEAGELAGFAVERIINEPTAAALAYGLNNLDKDCHLLVYDLGGGTFDVSVVELMGGIMEVKATSGDRMLGGEDFDWMLVDWMAEQIIVEHGVDPRLDIRGKALLKETAERVKIELSSQETAEVSLPIVTVAGSKPIGLKAAITRQLFESLIEPVLQRSLKCVQDALQAAGVRGAELEDILLVGGSTRIPLVHRLIAVLLGKQPRVDVNPDLAVALGAAVQAGLKSGALSKSGLIVTDVAPYSMGIAVAEQNAGGGIETGKFARIIPRNTTIPVTRKEKYYTSYLGQTAVRIEIYQGEHDRVKHNSHLGSFMLDGLPVNEEDHEAVEVTFRYNLNGILEVSAKSMSTGKEMSVVVQDALQRDSQAQFEASAAKLEELWDQAKAGSADAWLDGEDGEELLSALEELWGGEGELDDEAVEQLDLDTVGVGNASGIVAEADRVVHQAKSWLEQQPDHTELAALIGHLQAAIAEGDEARLQELVPQAIDIIIELELG